MWLGCAWSLCKYQFHFNSRTPSGVWLILWKSFRYRICFNSYTPSGVWRQDCIRYLKGCCFNSHTPSGVWRMGIIELSTLRVSTHTLQVECDVFGYSYNMSYSCFNSHTPSGVWYWKNWQRIWWLCFNSHTPSGVWLELQYFKEHNIRLFQLTHSKWSVMVWPSRRVMQQICFNSHSKWSVMANISSFSRRIA